MTIGHPEIQSLTLNNLFVDPEVQRNLNQVRAGKLTGAFNPAALGVITVSARPGGQFHIVDGQTRVTAARAAGYDEPMVANVYSGLTQAEEAWLFLLLNDTRQVSPLDKFRIRVAAGEPIAVDLNNILAKHGWKVTPQPGDEHFMAVVAAEIIYKRSVETFDKVIAVITEAWDHDARSADGRMVAGLGLVIQKYPEINLGELVERLRKYKGGHQGLIAAARQFMQIKKLPSASAIAEVIVDAYNHQRKTTRIPEWGASRVSA